MICAMASCKEGRRFWFSLWQQVAGCKYRMSNKIVNKEQTVRCFATSARQPQTMIEKIVQRHTVGLAQGQAVHAGDYVSVQPAYVMTHDNTMAVMAKFQEFQRPRMARPRQVVCTLDHNVQDRSPKNIAKYAAIEAFCKQHGIDFYPAGRGIGHQVMCEEGYCFPLSMVVASDSHSNMYGGLGCLGTPVVRTDAAAIWATGQTWWQVPPTAKVVLQGRLAPGATGKDVILALCGAFNSDEVLNHAVEFTGPGTETLTVDQRLTVANMTTEWGALAGVFAPDDVLWDWLEKRCEFVNHRGLAGVPSDSDGDGEHPRLNFRHIAEAKEVAKATQADTDARYSKILTLDLSTVQPHVAGPDSVKKVRPLAELCQNKIPIQKAYLVSCVNSRASDIAAAAEVVAGKHVAQHVEFYVAAASDEIEAKSRQDGHWDTLLKAGAKPLPPGCGPCIGLGAGLLKDGEVGISATNRNFKGRMGSASAQAYLASPAVVAASAVVGYITGPVGSAGGALKTSIEVPLHKVAPSKPVKLCPGFPATLKSSAVLCLQDNINTDGIYPGKYTYQDDLGADDMARVAMENYDAQFSAMVRKGDILIGGYNFGCGSSREQAATALKCAGVQLVVAGSFSETYKRNAINNALLVLEVGALVDDLKATITDKSPTVRAQDDITIDFATATVYYAGKAYPTNQLGPVVQELYLAGGLEAWTNRQAA